MDKKKKFISLECEVQNICPWLADDSSLIGNSGNQDLSTMWLHHLQHMALRLHEMGNSMEDCMWKLLWARSGSGLDQFFIYSPGKI